MEVDSEYLFNNGIKISAGYQLLYAKDTDVENKFKNGEVYGLDNKTSQSYRLNKYDYFGLYNKSRHMANINFNYENIKWKLMTYFRIIYRGKYGNFDSNSNGYLDRYDVFINDYFIFNFSIIKEFLKNYKIQFGINNLFNYTNVEHISNLPGRKIYIKLKLNY